jgi:hypothetical protein
MASREFRGRCRGRATVVSPRHQSLQTAHRRSVTPPLPYPQNEVRAHILVEPTPSLNPDHELWPHTRRLIRAIYGIFAFINEHIFKRANALSRVSCRVESHSVNITKINQDLAALRNSTDVFGNPRTINRPRSVYCRSVNACGRKS